MKRRFWQKSPFFSGSFLLKIQVGFLKTLQETPESLAAELKKHSFRCVKTAGNKFVSDWLCSKNIRSAEHLCQGLNSHYFHIIGDGHQPNSRGLYTHYKDSY